MSNCIKINGILHYVFGMFLITFDLLNRLLIENAKKAAERVDTFALRH